MAPLSFITEAVADADPKDWTGCGVAALDDFFRRHALTNSRRGLGKTFVMRSVDPKSPALLGFYTLSMAAIEGRRLPAALRAGLPRYPLPVGLIGRLAISRRAQGRGHGEALLADALTRIIAAAETVGCFGVIVDAKDTRAEAFYEKYGFVTLDDAAGYPKRMFLPMTSILAAT